ADRGERRVAAEPRPQPQGAGLRPPHRAVRAAVRQARPPHRAADGRDVPAAQLQGRADVRGGGDERHRGLRHAEGGGEARPDRAEKEVIGIRRATDDDRVAIGHYDHGEIMAVYVDPAHVRRGVGRLMMAKLEEVARADGATHLYLNAALNSVGFYAACGYQRMKETVYMTRGGLVIKCA